jgi:hypothetical protein
MTQLTYIPSLISHEDSYALLANYNVGTFREKMNRYLS